MEQSKDNRFIPMTSLSAVSGREITHDVFYYTNQIVNVIFIGDPATGKWVLVDAGMHESGHIIREIAEERFGKGSKPSAILLTHGHFDHVGGIVDLLSEWNVPVYAHPLEAPFLTGEESYPEPDASVEGGLLAKISSIYPNDPIDISDALQFLPVDGTVPGLRDWRWIHTPGHSPGQVAFYREGDGMLLSGDAFVTVKQDSFYKVLIQKEEVCGPPVYLTTDWQSALESVKTLAELEPRIVVPGHGTAMQGEALTKGLSRLVQGFYTVAIPGHGKYVKETDKAD